MATANFTTKPPMLDIVFAVCFLYIYSCKTARPSPDNQWLGPWSPKNMIAWDDPDCLDCCGLDVLALPWRRSCCSARPRSREPNRHLMAMATSISIPSELHCYVRERLFMSCAVQLFWMYLCCSFVRGLEIQQYPTTSLLENIGFKIYNV